MCLVSLLPRSAAIIAKLRRRNSLVVVTKQQKNVHKKVIMCVLRVPVTTPAQRTASPLSNLMVSWVSFAAFLTHKGPIAHRPKKRQNGEKNTVTRKSKERRMTHQDTMLIIRATLVAEQVAVRFTLLTMTKDDDEFQLYPCFNGLPSESLDDYTFEVEALVAGSKDDEKKLVGPRLVRRLGGVPGALARGELHMPDLTKPEGYKLILLFLEQKGYKKDALDKRLLANRRYEAVA